MLRPEGVKKPGQFRPGKTLRDLRNNCKSRNRSNKAARISWLKTAAEKRRSGLDVISDFPWLSCNGKRNACYNQATRDGKKISRNVRKGR